MDRVEELWKRRHLVTIWIRTIRQVEEFPLERVSQIREKFLACCFETRDGSCSLCCIGRSMGRFGLRLRTTTCGLFYILLLWSAVREKLEGVGVVGVYLQ